MRPILQTMGMLVEMDARTEPERFFEEVHPGLSRFVRGALGAGADADDVVQETLLAAWDKRDTFRGDSSLLTWVLSIARNRIRSRWRHDRRDRRAEEVLRAVAEMDATPLPEEIAGSLEMGERIQITLAEMDAEQADLLLRRHVDGQSVADIARVMGATAKSVEMKLYRARESFRDRFLSGGTP